MNLNHSMSLIGLSNPAPAAKPKAMRDDASAWLWRGEWVASSDGVCETRAGVMRSVDGFLPALEVSQRGGDCHSSFGDALRSLALATREARARERVWHTAQDLADLDAAGLVY